jgi:hypothetical protein
MRGEWRWLFLGALVVGLLPCGPCHAQGQSSEERKGTAVTIAGMESRTPGSWIEVKTKQQFRVKQFRLPRIGDQKDDAEVIVYYFGEGGAGSVEANVKRWKSMFVPPEGKTIEDVTKVEQKKINCMAATYFDAHGTYLFRASPMATETERRPNYRMINIILETKNGPYFFRLVGPDETVARYKKGFDEWIEGFK